MHVAYGSIDVLLRRLEGAKVVHSGVFCEELVLAWHLLQPHSASLERTVRQTRRAAARRSHHSVALAALHRNERERAVKAIYLRCVPLLAEAHKEFAQRRDLTTADPHPPKRGFHAWASDAAVLFRPIRTQVLLSPLAPDLLVHLAHVATVPAILNIGTARLGSVRAAIPLLQA